MDSSNDLIDLQSVKNWLGVGNKVDGSANTDEDSTIQFLITSFSQYVLNKTSRDSFTEVKNYVEFYDGNGRNRLFLRNTPVVSVTEISAAGFSIPESTTVTSSGWFIENARRSVAIRTPGIATVNRFSSPYYFPQGVGNIQVTYSAGYTDVPADLAEVVMKVVSINYRRKEWIDLASKSLSTSGGGTGTTRYRDWEMPPECVCVLDFYSRYARP